MTSGSMTAARSASDLYPPIQTDTVLKLLSELQPIGGELQREIAPAERTTLQNRAKQIAPFVQSAKPSEIKKIVTRCFMGLGGEKVAPEQAEMMMTQYVTVLSGVQAWAIERACLKFARGEVEASDVGAKHIEKGLRPSSAHLRIVACGIAASIDREAMALSKTLRAAPPKRRKETEEERAAGIERTKAWLEQNGGKQDQKKVPEPGYATRVAEQLRRRADQKVREEYLAAGLPEPQGEIVTSLPMLLEMGWSIVQQNGQNHLVKPDHPTPIRRSLGI